VKTEGKLASYEATLLPSDMSWLPLSENHNHRSQKRTVQPEDAFEETNLEPGVEIAKFETKLESLHFFFEVFTSF
jgi:hypothetical protein